MTILSLQLLLTNIVFHWLRLKLFGELLMIRNNRILNPGPDLASRLPGFIPARRARAGFIHSLDQS